MSDILINLKVNDANATTQMKALKDHTKELNNEIKDLDKTMKSNEKNYDSLNSKLSKQKELYDTTEERVKILNNTLDKQNKKLTEAKETYEQLTKEQSDNTEQLKKAKDSVDKYQSQVNKTESEIEKLTKQQSRLNDEIKQTEQAINKLPLDNLAKTFKTTGDKLKSFSDALKPMSVALGGMFGASIKEFLDFDEAMTKVQATSGATADEMKILSDKARELGQSTSFSAEEVANGFYYMSLAGWDVQQSLNGIDGVLQLSIASGEDLATVSDIVTDSLSAFGMKAEETGRFVDVLATTSSNSNTTVSMLGESFKNVAPLAGALGYSVEDVSTCLGILANNGIKSSESGTVLRNILANLSSPTKDVAKAMEKYNIALEDTDGTMKPLKDVMANLRDVFKELDENQQAELATTIAGKEGLSGLLSLVGSSDEDFNKLSDAISDSSGACQEMSDVMQSAEKNSVVQLKSKLSEMAITIGEKLMPVFQTIVDVVSDVVDWFTQLDDRTQENIIQMGLFLMALQPITGVLGTISTSLGGFIGKMTQAGIEAGATGSAFSIFSTGLIDSLGMIAGAVGPWLIGGACVVGVLAGIGVLYQEWSAKEEEKLLRSQGWSDQEIASYQLVGNAVSDAVQANIDEMQRLIDEALPLFETYTYTIGEYSTQQANSLQRNMNEQKNILVDQQTEILNTQLAIIEEAHEKGYYADERAYENARQQCINSYQMRISDIDSAYNNINDVIARKSQIGQTITDEYGNTMVYTQDMYNKDLEEGMRICTEKQNQYLEAGKQKQVDILTKYGSDIQNLSTSEKEAIVTESNTIKEETIKNAEALRDGKLEAYNNMSDEQIKATGKTRDQVIQDAIDECEQTIENAEKMHEDVYKEVYGLKDDVTEDSSQMKNNMIDDSIEMKNTVVPNWKTVHSTWDNWTPQKKTCVVETKYTTVGSPSGGVYNPSIVSPRAYSEYDNSGEIELRSFGFNNDTNEVLTRNLFTTYADEGVSTFATNNYNGNVNHFAYSTPTTSVDNKLLNSILRLLKDIKNDNMNNNSNEKEINFIIEQMNVNKESDVRNVAIELGELMKMQRMGRGE